MNDFFKVAGVDAQAIGNHEFDLGNEFLRKYLNMKKSSVNLAANIIDEKGEF